LNLESGLKELYRNGIWSLFFEGCAKIFNQFIMKRLVDEFSFFVAPKHFGSGVEGLSREASRKAGQFILDNHFASYMLGSDSLTTGIVERK